MKIEEKQRVILLLLEKLKAQGAYQKDLAEHMGMSKENLNRIIKNGIQLTMDHVHKMNEFVNWNLIDNKPLNLVEETNMLYISKGEYADINKKIGAMQQKIDDLLKNLEEKESEIGEYKEKIYRKLD